MTVWCSRNCYYYFITVVVLSLRGVTRALIVMVVAMMTELIQIEAIQTAGKATITH